MRRRRDRDRVMNALLCNLQELKAQHAELIMAVEGGRMRLKLLEESITDLQQVAYFKQSMEQALHMFDEDAMNAMDEDADDEEQQQPQPPAQQQQHPNASDSSSRTMQAPSSTSGSPSYVVSLLQNVQPGLVEQLLSWRAVDWHRAVNDAAFSICLLLQLAARNIFGGTTSSYYAVAEKELFKAVDDIVTVGALGTIFVQVTGKELGVCTSLNHITMQEEAPPQDHWQHVLQQLQLSRPQLLKLAACYQEFTRQRKAQRALHADVTKAVACNSSCSLQLAAACAELVGAPSTDISSCPAASGACSAGEAAGLEHPSIGGDAGSPEPASLSAVLADGEQQAITAPDPSVLMTRLLVMVNHSLSMPYLVLHNTLSRQQIARMLVASYPFVPRPGPIMEAASQFLTIQQLHSGTPGVDEAGEEGQ